MISPLLFDALFVLVGGFAGWRTIEALKSGTATYQTGRVTRTTHPWAFWIVTIGYAAMVVGAIYGIAISMGA